MLIALAVFFGASALTAYSTSLSERPQRAVEDRTSAGKHLTAPVYFRQGRSNIDRSFMGNQARIDTFLNSLRRILADTTIRITDVTVTGLASVEGKFARNRQLAGQRAEALANLLVREGGLSKSLIQTVNGGENWDGLRAMVEASSDIPDKQAVLDIFKRKGFNRDSLKYTLMYYKGGRAWMYMYEKFFPTLRTGAGGIGSERHISPLGEANLLRLREALVKAGVNSATLERIGLGENSTSLKSTDVEKILSKLKEVVSPAEYERLSHQAFDGMLQQTDEVSDINWKLLREYIAQSDIEGKDSILFVIDNVPAAAGRERLLRRLNNGKSYREIERLYPELLMPAGSYASGVAAEKVRTGVARLHRMLLGSGIKGSEKVAAELKREKTLAGQQRVVEKLRNDSRYNCLLSDAGIPDASQFAKVVAEENALNSRIASLQYMIAASKIKGSDKVVASLRNAKNLAERAEIIETLRNDPKYRMLIAKAGIPDSAAVAETVAASERLQASVGILAEILAGTETEESRKVAESLASAKTIAEQQKIIESLRKDSRYKSFIEKAGIPEASVFAQAAAGATADPGRSALVEENWSRLRRMVSESTLPQSEKRKILEIIDTTPDPSARLEKIMSSVSGQTRERLTADFFPELLYGLSPAAKQNWEIVEKAVRSSDFEGKEEVLKIMRDYPAGEERAEALRRLDGGKVWNKVREQAFSSLLLDSEEKLTQQPVSGISLTFEPTKTEQQKDLSELSLNNQAGVDRKEDITEKREVRTEPSKVSVDITTDLVRDAGVQPGFIFGGPTPNLSLGINFAGHLAIQVSAAYCNWNALTGDKGLFAVTGYGGEIRYMFGKKYRYNGIYTGIAFTMGDFDVQEKDLTRGDTGTYWNAGISAGYLLRLGGFIMDFGVRLGYSSASCDGYLIGHGNYEGHFYREGSFTEGKFSPAVRIGIGYRFGR